MAATNFSTILAFVLQEEGGWVDDPHDPGGMTNKGITLRTLRSFHHGATPDDLRHISDATAALIYRREYWMVMACDGLPAGVDIMVMDFGVNAGQTRSVGYLQSVAGVRRDGVDGAQTQAMVAQMPVTHVITTLAALQRAHYRALPTFGRYGEGWMARTDRRITAALKLLPAHTLVLPKE